ncbi:Asp-tRNA(Asn)/Glu-tRNA(Gln) amidotransferase subunit GatB [Patulibacter brassicae]|uniref:Aspartyl/glutamyl-tRNA(Asn/Gln) amidotransferase subunit B n=1 Tax=Patulibacter brassicae TaxID=1705717 RepID=A0ABU4VEU7_9ACTN|nr:Asp-tRNA(Asn)/Glu-tRNA(Gln) amidotransferase subunit GatB [Patulibacter brassicae]MDX8150336.1 Asp-tRNA(Asn)/Glu-tRNA(Gln) amidotransferase subunit GatB [Patulibacter brassicae]
MSEVAYEPVIGLEIHVQLATRTKMFCPCELSFGEPPNTRTCPVCLGLPGTLPVVNQEAVRLGLMIGIAFGGELASRSVFHRKNYFYPDLPKGYQISQFDLPLVSGGRLGDVELERVHLEEDAAKLNHAGASGGIGGSTSSVVDFNRGGTPLAEIVTRPDIRSAEQASAWLRLLRETLRQLGVSDVNMEEGSLRCDANVSIRPVGETTLGTKTELKNMNSFRFIEQGINAEVARQTRILQSGGQVEQETLNFDPRTGAITSLRSKEAAHDYRYFPEPDLPPLRVPSDLLEAAQAAVPELPLERAERFRAELGLHEESARLLAFRRDLGDYYEAVVAAAPADLDRQQLANWVGNDLVRRLAAGAGEDGADEDAGTDPAQSKVEPAALAELVALVQARTITRKAGEQVLDALVAEGGSPQAIVEREGLAAIGGGDELRGIVEAALDANPDVVEKLRTGNMKPIGVIVGHVMRETKGRADGGEVTKLAREILGL